MTNLSLLEIEAAVDIVEVKDLSDLECYFPCSIPEIIAATKEDLLRSSQAFSALMQIPLCERTLENTFIAHDEIQTYLHSAAQKFKTLFTLHPDPSVRAEAERSYLQVLRASEPTQEVYKFLLETYPFMNAAPIAQEMIAEMQKQEFDLPLDKFAYVQDLKNQIRLAEAAFASATKKTSEKILLSERDLEGFNINLLTRRGRFFEVNGSSPKYLLLSLCVKAETRKRIFQFFNGTCTRKNSSLLKQLLALREQLAKLLGYPNFAAFDNASVKYVEDFLKSLLPEALTMAEQEVKSATGESTINPWDECYFVDHLQKQKILGYSDEEFQKQIPFNLVKILSVLSNIVGLQFIKVQADLWHHSLQVFEVKKNGKSLGFIIYDLEPRNGKNIDGYCFDNLSSSHGKAVATVACCFENPKEGLTCTDLFNLLHETGHACHQLLGKSAMPSKCGFHVPVEVLEVPSLAFENLGYNTDFLVAIGIPHVMAEAVSRSREIDRGLVRAHDIFFSMLALRLHINPNLDVEALHKLCMPHITYDPETYVEGGFTHLADPMYRSRYFAYLYSQEEADKVTNLNAFCHDILATNSLTFPMELSS